jgi:hypothetical protein
MSRDSGLTVGEETADLHFHARRPVREALHNSRPHRFAPGRHRAKPEQYTAELGEPTVGPTVPRWADTTFIPAVVPDVPLVERPTKALPSRAPGAALSAPLPVSRRDRMVQGFLQALQTIRRAASVRGEL